MFLLLVLSNIELAGAFDEPLTNAGADADDPNLNPESTADVLEPNNAEALVCFADSSIFVPFVDENRDLLDVSLVVALLEPNGFA